MCCVAMRRGQSPYWFYVLAIHLFENMDVVVVPLGRRAKSEIYRRRSCPQQRPCGIRELINKKFDPLLSGIYDWGVGKFFLGRLNYTLIVEECFLLFFLFNFYDFLKTTRFGIKGLFNFIDIWYRLKESVKIFLQLKNIICLPAKEFFIPEVIKSILFY